MMHTIIVTPRIFPGMERGREMVFQMVDKKGRYIGDEVPIILSEMSKGPIRLRITDKGIEFDLKSLT